ncbi:MAG TPA: prepilin-type N-terminal cleavage/methylation domain-containing protein [Candidatus Sulfotelmatobacter sp.]|nr:prepilin-type N-terminal cleavage/methylation domain-containing protein [Candidatus Sulfotelmatobacter sp.]
MIKNKITRRDARNIEGGFTLIEVLIAIVVAAIGLLALVASFATAIQATQSAEEDLIARQKVLEAMESIYTARNAQQIPFASIANVAQGGIFLDGAQPLKCAGPDGLVNTADDVVCTTQAGANCPGVGAECMVLPGPDGTLGTIDDVTMSLGNFTRTIAITPVLLPGGAVNNNMAAIAITVTYTKDGWPARSYTANSLISSYH